MRVFCCFFMILGLCATLPARAAPLADPIGEGLTKRVLDGARIVEHLESYRQAYRALANTSLVTMNDGGQQRRVLLALEESFDIDLIYRTLQEDLLSRYDQATLRRLAEYLESPAVAAMIREERRINDPGAQEEMASYLAQLKAFPPAPQRIELLNAIEAARHGAENEADAIILILDAMATSLESFLSSEELERQRQMVSALKENRQALAAESRPDLMLNYYFIYRYAGDEQLREYLSALRAEIGQTYVAFASRAVPLAIAASQQRAAERIAEILRQGEGEGGGT